MRVFHTGVATDINSRSVGIEIVNPGHEFGYRPFPAPQIAAVLELGLAIVARHAIPARNVIAHSDIAPGRKTDPGELFPWRELATSGLGVWVESTRADVTTLARGMEGQAVRHLQEQLSLFGYGIAQSGVFDEETEIVVREFQRHFRQSRLDGSADAETQGLIVALNAMIGNVA